MFYRNHLGIELSGHQDKILKIIINQVTKIIIAINKRVSLYKFSRALNIKLKDLFDFE